MVKTVKPLTDERRKRVDRGVRSLPALLHEIPQVADAAARRDDRREWCIYCGSRRSNSATSVAETRAGTSSVYLPKEHIVATGDLVVAPTPFGIGS